MLENFDQATLQGIYAIIANEYGLTLTLDQALTDPQTLEVIVTVLSDLTPLPPSIVKTPRDQVTTVTPRDNTLQKVIANRTVESKGRRNTRTSKNKTVNTSVSENIAAIAFQDHIRSDNYAYIYDRRLTFEITPKGVVYAIDKKLKVKITIGKFISYHPDYTFIVSNQTLSLNLLITIQTLISQLRDVSKFTSQKLEDLRYWLTFRDKTNPVTLALVENKKENDFSAWYSTQNFTSLKNWIKRQAKKGIDTKNWYIQLDTQKLIDDQRIKEVWEIVNGYATYNSKPKLK